jgi:hypothetical protein
LNHEHCAGIERGETSGVETELGEFVDRFELVGERGIRGNLRLSVRQIRWENCQRQDCDGLQQPAQISFHGDSAREK